MKRWQVRVNESKSFEERDVDDRTGGFDLKEQLVADGVAIPIIFITAYIIFITAYDDAQTRERVRQSGVAGYLPKSFADGALLDMIRTVAGPA
jgi:CheY-like chemotaxis protein